MVKQLLSVVLLVAGTLLPAGAEACAPTDDALCLGDDRFEVSVEWRTPDGDTGIGDGAAVQDLEEHLEVPGVEEPEHARVDGLGHRDDRFWVYFAATTDVEFQVTVQDKRTDTTQTYTNPQGQPANAVTDGNAFETCGVE